MLQGEAVGAKAESPLAPEVNRSILQGRVWSRKSRLRRRPAPKREKNGAAFEAQSEW